MWAVADRVWAWLADHPRLGLSVALLLTAALRLPAVNDPLSSDEGGYLYVAQHWPGPGSWLYGDQWVDRPPVLIAVFKLATLAGGSRVDLRVLAILVACLMVASAWWAGRMVAGNNGALVAALVVAALGSNRLIRGSELNGDGIGAAFVMASCALLLAGMNRSAEGRRSAAILLVGAAGLVSALAFLTKQNALLGAVVAAVLLVARLRSTWRLVLAYAGGAAIPLAATLVWAALGPGLPMLVNAVWSFRTKAAARVYGSGLHFDPHRLGHFALLVLATGLILLLAQLAAVLVAGSERDHAIARSAPPVSSPALRTAIAAGAAYLVVSLVASLSWLSYYMLAFVPLVALSTALATRADRRRAPLFARAVAVLAVACSVVAVWQQRPERYYPPTVVASYIGQAARPTDSLFVAYGQPNVLQASGLRAAYPYSWALPVRVEDPHLRLLTHTLAGPHAPTWLAEMSSFDVWNTETPRMWRVLRARYRIVAVVCGHPVYLIRGAHRALPPDPPCGTYDAQGVDVLPPG